MEAGTAVVLSARLIDERLVFIAATPDTAHIIWRVSDEPDIDILRRRTGLAGETHAVEVGSRRGGVNVHRSRIRTVRQHGLLHRVGQQEGRRGLHRLPRLVLARIDEHIALLIEDLREELRLVKLTSVRDRREGLRKLEVRHTVRDTAERERRVLIAVEQARDAEVLRVQPSLVRIQLLHQAAHRDDVQRVDDTVPDRLIAEEAGAVPVLEGLVAERIRRIIERGGQCCPIEVDGRCEGRNQLEGRSRLPEGAGCTVQGERIALLTTAAADGLHLAGVRVHEHEGNLRLQGREELLAQLLIGIPNELRLILLDIGLRRVLRAEEAVEVDALHLLHPADEVLLGVVHDRAVVVLQRIAPGHGMLRRVIVVRIIDLLIDDGLEARILGRVDREATGVQEVGRLVLRIAEAVLELLDHLCRQLIHEVGVRLILGLLLYIDILDTRVHVVRPCFIILRLIDIALLEHVLQHLCTALCISLRMRDRVQAARILRDRCDHGTLGERQIAHFFIKVTSRRHLDAEGIRTEVDGVQILGDDTLLDFFLAESRLVLDLEGQVLLLELPDITLELSFVETSAEDIVLDQLLRDRRAAARGVVIRHHAADRTEDRLQVDAVVLPEALILDRDEGVDEVLRELLVAYALTI